MHHSKRKRKRDIIYWKIEDSQKRLQLKSGGPKKKREKEKSRVQINEKKAHYEI